MKMTGAQIICESLMRESVDVVFGDIGAMNGPLHNTIRQYPQIRYVTVNHGQDAAHAADGYARATGKVGICLATSGIEATNLVTGIASAFLDSSPVVAITSQVATSLLGRDAFQEVDITGVTMPITKHNYLVMEVKSLATVIKEAFYLSRTGRPGPVLVDVPRDVLIGEAKFSYPDKVDLPSYKPTLRGHPTQISKAAKLINEAHRPVVIAGQGVNISGACHELKKLAETGQIPVVTTLLGIGSFPETHALSFGMLGMHGMACANMAVDAADLILAIGMRFDDRATGNVSLFAPNARIIHVDVDPAEISKIIPVDVPIVGDVKQVLSALNKLITASPHNDWLEQIHTWHEEHPLSVAKGAGEGLPQYVIRQLYELTGGEATIVTGVGQHQMWAAQYYLYDKPRNLITSGGLGSMGYSLPAAIGAKIGDPDRIVWSVDGDGGFQMTMRELSTVARENLDLKIALFNNSCLGMVRQLQEFYCDKRYIATPLSGPDFMKIAEAYGIPSLRVEHKAEVAPAIQKAMEHQGPFLIEFIINPGENVYPMVLSGMSLSQFLEGPKKEPVAP